MDGTGMKAKDVKPGMTIEWFGENAFRTVVDVQPVGTLAVQVTAMNSESATLFNDTDVMAFDD
jgi:hypothetical protein